MAKCSYCRKSMGVIHGTQPRYCTNTACQKVSCSKCAKTMLGFSSGSCPHCGTECANWLLGKPKAKSSASTGGGGGGSAGGGVMLVILITIGVYWDEIMDFFGMVFIVMGSLAGGVVAIWLVRQLGQRVGYMNAIVGVGLVAGGIGGGAYLYNAHYDDWAREQANPMHRLSVMADMDLEALAPIPEALRGTWQLEERGSQGEVNGRTSEVTITSATLEGLGGDAPIRGIKGAGSGAYFTFRGERSGYEGPLPCAGLLENPAPGLMVISVGCRSDDGEAERYVGTLQRAGQTPSAAGVGSAAVDTGSDIPTEWRGAYIHRGEYAHLQVVVSAQGIFGWEGQDQWPLVDVRGALADGVYTYEAFPLGSYEGGRCQGTLETSGEGLVLTTTCQIAEEESSTTMKLTGHQPFGASAKGLSLTSLEVLSVADGTMTLSVGQASTGASARATISVGLADDATSPPSQVLGQIESLFRSRDGETQRIELSAEPQDLAGKHLVASIATCADQPACQQRIAMARSDVGFVGEPAYKKRGRTGSYTFVVENRGPSAVSDCKATLSLYGRPLSPCKKKRGGKDCIGPKWGLEGEWPAGETRKLVYNYSRKDHGGGLVEGTLTCGAVDLAPQDNALRVRLER